MEWGAALSVSASCRKNHSSSNSHLLRTRSSDEISDMKGLLFLSLLLFLEGQRSLACPRLCACHGSQVNCSSRSLTPSLLPPTFPAGTTTLLLHNNMLTTLPRGLLDDLTSLHSISLHGNPWVCDCGILYLRSWLLRQPPGLNFHQGVTCSSPPSLRGRLAVYITEEEALNSSHHWYCDLASGSLVFLLVLVVLQVALLVALVIFLRKFEKLAKEAKRIREESFTAEDNQRENEYTSYKESNVLSEMEL
ncbi:platelet glycoprotein Ib beta chain [Salarias fasciatus]|uniref:platelet glycoprotein Ib beta chain n=1 Tax=Salarias fasciatus TaxID=181472 RepID=UPI001176AAAE|nr:platelet glycoprotein Ib beta chain [Salarias fasciatus]